MQATPPHPQKVIHATTLCGEPRGHVDGVWRAALEEGHEGLPRRRRTDERGEHGVTEILQDLRALSPDRREERRPNRVNQLVRRMSLRGRPRHGSHDTRVGGWRRWDPPVTPATPSVIVARRWDGESGRTCACFRRKRPRNHSVNITAWYNRSDTGPSKPRVAGSNPAGRASFLKNSPLVPHAWAPGAKVQANTVTGRPHRLAD